MGKVLANPLPDREVAVARSAHVGVVEKVAAAALSPIRECPECGLFQKIPALAGDDVDDRGGSGESAALARAEGRPSAAHCGRCGGKIRSGRHAAIPLALVCAGAGAVLLAFAADSMFLSIHMVGGSSQATLVTGPEMLSKEGLWELGVVVFVVLIAMPALKLFVTIAALTGSHLRRPPGILPWLFAWRARIAPWAMVEVFLVGVFVAYTRLRAFAQVQVGPALIAVAGLTLAMIGADASLDEEKVWRRLAPKAKGERAFSGELPGSHAAEPAGIRISGANLIACGACRLVNQAAEAQKCARCGHTLQRRKPESQVRTWALLIAAAILYVPANMLPIMTVVRLGRGGPNTIMSGVFELIDAKLWPLAALVFVASILIPVFKLAGLVTLLILTHRKSPTRLEHRTKLYRFIHGIGRWSMIDIFMLTTLVGLVRMGFFLRVLPNTGALAFCAVVVLTMFATHAFDPRSMWDAAGENDDPLELAPA